VEQRFAKEFSVGRMNESVRSQNAREIRKRLSGGEKKTEAPEFIALMLKTRLGRQEGLAGEFLGFCVSASNDAMGFSWRSLLRSVIRLAEFEGKCVDEMGACAQKDAREAILERYCDESGPPGMSAKPEGGMLHKTPQGYPTMRRR
jgi:hypothetical protein